MSTKDRLYGWLNDGTFDPEKGCRHPIDVIAAALECSERTVIRCSQRLEREGRLRVDRPGRRGVCNTYWVAVWNPSKRSDVLRILDRNRAAVLRLRKERRNARCHPKRTAAPSRAQTPRTDNSLYVVDQRCGRENNRNLGRREARNRFERSRGVPEPARSLHLVGCPECERRKRTAAAMQVDLDNLETELKVKRRRITQLENELAEKHRQDPNYSTAEVIFDYWRKKCMPTARTFSEDRVKAVLARLKDRDRVDPDQSAYSPRYICEAIVGAAVGAYVDDKGKCHNDLELICRTGKKLEDFHARYERWKGQLCANGHG